MELDNGLKNNPKDLYSFCYKLPFPCCIINQTKKIIFYNQHFQTLFRDTNYCELPPNVMNYIDKKIKQETQISEIINIDNLEKNIHCNVKVFPIPIFDNNYILIFQDENSENHNQDLIKEKEKQRERLLENVNSIILRMDPFGKILYMNNFALNFFGYNEAEIIGKNVIGTIVPIIESNSNRNLTNLILDIKKKPNDYSYNENENVLKDGTRKWLQWSNKVLYNENGEVQEIFSVGTDITAKKKTENLLKQSEEKFTKAFLSSPTILVISTKKEGRIIEANDAFCKRMGYTHSEVIGKTSIELGVLTVRQRKFVEELLFNEGKIQGREIKFKNRFGDLFIGLFFSEEVELNEESCLLSSIIDITEMKKTEDALSLSEKKFSKLFLSNPIPSFIISIKDRVFFEVNDAFCKTLEIPKEDIIRKHIDNQDFFSLNSIIDKLKQEEFKQLSFEMEYHSYSGKIKVGFFSIDLIEINNDPCLIGSFIDITENKKNMEDLEFFLKRNHDLISLIGDFTWEIDSNLRITYVSDQVEKILGYTPQELLGATIEILGMDLINFASNFKDPVKKEKISLKDIPCIHKKGTKVIINFDAIHYFRDDQSYYWGIGHDVTDQHRRDEERIRIEKLSSLSLLAEGVAHDFNNTLMSILGNISIILSSDKKKEMENYWDIFKEIEKSVYWAKDLTTQLLNYSKRGVPIKKTFNIVDVIKEVTQFSLSGSKSKYEFVIENNKILIDADLNLIKQVLSNIIQNADQSMPKGGIIKIVVNEVELNHNNELNLEHGKYVLISIIDQGVGIKENIRQKIFDPYFTTKERGTGLGLATSYSIIKKHNGTILFNSLEGVGSIFYIYIPLGVKNPIAREDNYLEFPPLSGVVLVLDDDISIHHILEKIFLAFGIEGIFTFEGNETLKIFEQCRNNNKKVDLILLDLTISGGMGGKETMFKINELDPHVPVIASSGYVNDLIALNYKYYGFSDFLPKPYSVNQIYNMFKKFLKKK